MAKWSSVLSYEAMCFTIISYSNKEHPRATKSRYTKLWGDHPQWSFLSTRCLIPKLPTPSCHLKQEAPSVHRRICHPWYAWVTFWALQSPPWLARSQAGDGQTPPWSWHLCSEGLRNAWYLGGLWLVFLSTPQSTWQELASSFQLWQSNKFLSHCEISVSVPAHSRLLFLWHFSTLGNYWGTVGHIKFFIKVCALVLALLL